MKPVDVLFLAFFYKSLCINGSNSKIIMLTIHVVAGVLMIAVCWTPAIVGNISVWNKLFCTAAIILLLRFHYWCQQYEP